jgi:hypothetical protein
MYINSVHTIYAVSGGELIDLIRGETRRVQTYTSKVLARTKRIVVRTDGQK